MVFLYLVSFLLYTKHTLNNTLLHMFLTNDILLGKFIYQ